MNPLRQQTQRILKVADSKGEGISAHQKRHVYKFLDFVHWEYKLQGLKNLSDKHVLGWLEYAKLKDISPNVTISGMQFVHAHLQTKKQFLSGIAEFNRKFSQLPTGTSQGHETNSKWSVLSIQIMVQAYEVVLSAEKQSDGSYLVHGDELDALRQLCEAMEPKPYRIVPESQVELDGTAFKSRANRTNTSYDPK